MWRLSMARTQTRAWSRRLRIPKYGLKLSGPATATTTGIISRILYSKDSRNDFEGPATVVLGRGSGVGVGGRGRHAREGRR